jgi:spore coat polysaccharide biosynthesis protein SpsF (cytidylyltransferase family)/phosphoglycolate phosphatase-like HAD superfamily hydrolase
MGSERLKNKAMLLINGKTIIEIIFGRLKLCKEIDGIILSTSNTKENDILAMHAKKINLECHRGPENDLIDRHLGALKKMKADAFIKITADCPLVDFILVDKMANFFRNNYKNFDFFTNSFPPTYPDGLDLDITPLNIVKKIDKEIDKKSPHRDFFIAYIMSNPSRFRIYNMRNSQNLSSMRWTLDYPEDYEFVKKIFSAMGDIKFNMDDILKFLLKNPEINEINKNRIDNIIANNIRSGAYYSTIKKQKKLLILDFDRTIVDLNVDWQAIKEKITNIFALFGISPDIEKPLFERIKDASKRSALKEKNNKLEDLIYKKCLTIIRDEELLSLKKCQLINGTKDFLKWMQAEKREFVVLSNNNTEVIKKVFIKFKLPLPKIIIGSDSVEKQKPDTEGINKILIKFKKAANECILVGDSKVEVEIGDMSGVKTYIMNIYNKEKNIKIDFTADFVENFNQLKEILKNG